MNSSFKENCRQWILCLALILGLVSANVSQAQSSDSDGDGVNDPVEIADGTNPNDASSFNNLNQGLAAYFPLSNTYQDLTGNLSSISPNGTSFSSNQRGELNGAISFNTSQNARIRGLSSVLSGDVMTFSGWFYYNAGIGHPMEYGFGFKQYLYSETAADGSHPEFRINLGGDPYNALQINLGGNSIIRPGITPEFGKWYHWAITVKAGVNKGWSLYSNGQFVASGTSEAPDRLEWPSDFGIGGSIEGGNFYWGTPSNGRVNNLRFYNRTLSASEIGQLYQQEAGSLDTDGDGLTDAWESGYGRYSLIGVNSLSWGQAKADAEARGGHLATITSAEEWTRIYQIVGDQTFDNVARAFLGGRQISKANEPAGGWEWITGEPWAYTNFATAQSQPDNRGNLEDYLEILGKREPSPFFWNDHYQNTDHYLLEFGYPTDPTKADTDGDGVDDKTESLAGTDPNDSTINSWDFVHSYKNVYSSNALDYVFDQQNIARVSEGGITYWSPAAGGQEARLTQKFVFNRPTASAFLHINYIYVASFSGAGSGSLWASKDGNEWTQLVDAPTPSFAAGYGFNDYLPKNLMGSNEIWIQARLQSSGWNIMAQFLRYDAAWRTDNAFDLKVRLDSHDTSPPIITLIGSNPLEIYKGSAFTDPGAAVTDNRDATRAITGNGSVDTGTVGFYSLTYTTTDAAGNLAAPVTRTVSVVLDPAADEDGDGLTNGTEIAGGTNPYQKDSDGDGVNDPVEIADETNPNDPSSYNNLNKGLVAYYPFNGNANDESGNGYHATNIGGTFVAGLRQQNSGSLHFDGASAYAQSSISNLPPQNSPRTLSLWIKSELRPDLLANEHIVGYGSFPPTEGFGVGIYAGSGGRLFGYCSFNDIPADKYADSGWVHFVHVYDGLESRIYADGLLVGSLRQQLRTQGNDAFTLGARQATDSANQIVNFYRGSLDDVRLYNRALSSAEIALMYENQASSLDTDGDGLTDAWERGYGRYQIVPSRFTWDQSKADAEVRGGHLATFTSEDEWNLVWGLLGSSWGSVGSSWTTAYWIGGSDAAQEGIWRWTTGERWNYSRWCSAQPSGGAENNLITWYPNPDGMPGWNDGGDGLAGESGGYLLEFGYPTDPNKADTDGDGVNDNMETVAGTDPNNPAAYPVWENPTLVETISPSNGLGIAALDFADRIALNQGWLATHQHVAGGQIHVLQRQANGTSFAQTIQPPDAVYTTGFGESLSINEAGVLFAQSPLTYRQIPHEGTAYLFSRSGNTYGLSSAWTEEAQTAGRFSMNGKILGDTLVVFKPAVWDYNIKCTIFVYRVSSSGQKELIGKIAQTDGTYQMGGVGLSSSHIAVHLTSSDSSKTPKLAIYSLIRDSSGNLTGVTNLQTLDVSGTHEGDRDCLDIEGDWMALGDRQADMVYAGSTQAQAGRVTIFHRDSGGVWSPQQTLLSPQLAAGENFGECLVIQGGRLYVGSPGTAANGGKPLGVVYAYKLEGGRAVLKSIVRPSQSMSSTEIFGSALAKTPGVLAVGSTGGLRQSVSGGIYLYQIAEPDALAPLITLIGANPLEVYKGATFTDPGATVTDNVDETRTITGSGTVDASSVGIYTFTYTATDAAGNLALPVERTVNVVLDPAADEDGDGLSNGTENSGGTNPYQRDSDGDGVNDPVELADGTNPNDTTSYNNLNKGLVAYYPFNGNANDESGNGNHGISVGTASDSDRTGEDNKAQRFSSASRSRIEIPWQSSQVVGITCFSFWFKTAGAIDQARFVISGSAGYDFVFHLTSAARIDGLRFIPSPYVVIDSTEPYEAGIWNHVVAVSGANTTEQGIWLNGKKIQSVNTLGDPALKSQHGSNRLWIGGSIDVPEADIRYFDGWIDDVRIYSRALSSNEVGQLYQNEAGSLDTDGDGLTDAWERGYGRYQIIPGNFTWEQAKADAEARGGHLVTITSQDEWNMIWSLLGPSWGSTVYWMGGTDQGTDGNWRWVTGENWLFNRWYPSQPSGGGEHQLLSSGNLPDGQPGWNDGFGMYQPGNFGGYLLEFGYPTDPNLADTDGDGFNDKVESLGGGDPNNPASLPQLIANNDTVDRDGRSGSSTAIALSHLLGNDQYITATPPTVSLPSRTTAQGGSVLLENGWVIYTGLSGLASSAGDSFGYRITDSLGNKADGMVFLNAGIYSSGVNIVRVVGATPPATGVISYFAVIPNKRYTVYATSSLSPVNWSNLGTFTSDSKGQLAVPDPIVASSRFYKMEVLFP